MKEKSKFNKVMNVIVAIIFICALAYAAYYVAIVKYDLLHTKEKAVQAILEQNQDEEKVVSKKVGECKGPWFDNPQVSWNKDVIQNVISEKCKYLFVDYKGEGDYVDIWSLSKKDMQKKLKELPDDSLPNRIIIKDVDELKEMATALLINLGNYDFLHRTDKKEIYLSYTGVPITCLDGLVFNAPPGTEFCPQSEIPRLSFDNVDIETVFVYWNYVCVGAVISADVTCDKMTDLGKKLDWVPDEGKTKRVTFIMDFYIDSTYEMQNVDIVNLEDMDIIN